MTTQAAPDLAAALARYVANRAIRIYEASGPGLVVCIRCERAWPAADWHAHGHCPDRRCGCDRGYERRGAA